MGARRARGRCLRPVATEQLPDGGEEEETAKRVDEELTAAIAALSSRQKVILKLRFQHDMKVADIARLADVPARVLYRELSQIAEDLRNQLHRKKSIGPTSPASSAIPP